MSHRLELRCVWVEPCPKAFIIPRLGIDEFAVVGKMRHWHIEHTIDAWQTTGEEAVDQGDAGVLLTHALGDKDFVTGIVLAQHTRLDESLDRCHELRCLNGREHVPWNRPCTVGSGNRGDFYDVGGEAEQFQRWCNQVSELLAKFSLGTTESRKNDLRPPLRIAVAR